MLRSARFAYVLTIVGAAIVARDAHAIPSFPGAEGFGAAATGGRGGQVLKVTTLAASGAGSLQAALDVPGPRIIVFDVSGVIEGDITIPHGDVTIAGQTAPGAGITIAGQLFADYDAEVSNVIIRHVRVRPEYDGSAGEQFDGAQFSTSSVVILDHVSIAWGVDETLDMYEADDITVQWSTIEESGTEGHPEGAHNYGTIVGPDGFRTSIHHNLFIHHQNRNPAIANGPAEIINNVAYNVRHGFVHHNPASGPFDIVGNSYIAGPDDELIPFYFDDENGFTADDLGYYLADNYIDDPGVFTGTVNDPWVEMVHPSFEYLEAPESFKSATYFEFEGTTAGYIPITIQGAAEARDLVIERSGAFPRDVVTRRLLDEYGARNGDWGVDAPADLLEGLTPGAPPTDTDGDGMPDQWETDNGLDPANGDDHTTEMPSGYTAIEDYINGVADELAGEPPGPGPTGSGGGSGNGGNGPGSGGSSGNGGPGSGGGGSSADGADPSDSGDGCDCQAAPATSSFYPALVAGALALVRRRSRRS